MADDTQQQWPGTPVSSSGGAKPAPQAWPGTPVTAVPSAGAGREATIEQRPAAQPAPTQAPDAGAGMLQAHRDTEMAARQGVDPYATSPHFSSDPANRPERLGDLEEMDWGPTYKGPGGEYLRINPQTDFIGRDPETGRLAVYSRTPKADEWRITSAARLLAPGLATGPVTGIARAAPAATAATHVPPPMPLSSAAPPAVVARAAAPQLIGTPVGADLATMRAAELARDAEAFQRADVRPPPIAFMQGPMSQLGKQVSEIPFVGAPIKNSLDESLKGLSTATENLASRYGSASTPETAGSAIQQGIERFRDARPADIVERAIEGYSPEQLTAIITAPVRETSMKTKQAALYQRSWSYIPAEMQAGRTVETLPRYLGDMPTTRTVIDDIANRNLGMVNKARAARIGVREETAELLPTRGQAIPKIALPVQGGMLGRIVEDIAGGSWRGTLQSMRDVRSDFRRLASGMADTEKNTLRISDIERIQSAITHDMVNLLQRNASAYRQTALAAGIAGDIDKAKAMMKTAVNTERAIREFRHADQFTRLAAERMARIERLFNAPSAEALYRNIMNAALSKGKGDLEKLRILSKTLRPEEMNDVAAAVIRQLGEPVGSARGVVQELRFSPSSALTRWNNMSPEARALIFGHEHAQALDDWFRIVNRLANVEAMANTSRSGTYITNAIVGFGSAAMALNGHTALLGAGLALGGGLSLLLSRPTYVRWAIKYAELRAATLRAPLTTSGPRMVALVNQLGSMAKTDPALLPVVRAIASENGIGDRGDQNEPVKNQPRLH